MKMQKPTKLYSTIDRSSILAAWTEYEIKKHIFIFKIFKIHGIWDYLYICVLKQEFQKNRLCKGQIALEWLCVKVTSDRSSHSQMFFRTSDLKNSATKHQNKTQQNNCVGVSFY